MDNNIIKITNEHLPADWDRVPEIIALSAPDRTHLKNLLSDLASELADASDITRFKALAANTRRGFVVSHPCRLLLVMEKSETPVDLLRSAMEALANTAGESWNIKNVFFGETDGPRKLAFAFPGQGSQYTNMGRDLAVFFPEMRQCLEIANQAFGSSESLTDFIYPDPAGTDDDKIAAEERLRSTNVAQPAIGAVSASMISILRRFGITPDSTCGHSYGELTALFSAGRFDEKTFFDLSVARGKYMADAGGSGDKGGMLAVKAPMDRIEALIASAGLDVVLANRNSPDQGVLSGATDAIAKMHGICKENKLRAVVLPVAAAFHSRLVAAAAEPFEKKIMSMPFLNSRIPVYSNTTARPYPQAPDDAKQLLGSHLMNPVNFIEEIENMYQDGMRIFVEVGPRTVLTGLIKAILKDHPIHAMAVDASSGRNSGMTDLAKTLCMLAAIGYPVDLEMWRTS